MNNDDRDVTDEELAAMVTRETQIEPDFYLSVGREVGGIVEEVGNRGKKEEVGEVGGRSGSVGKKEEDGRGRTAIYPWEIWADGKTHRAVLGKDFRLTISRFQTVLHNAARARGLYVATHQPEEGTLEFKFCLSKTEARIARAEFKGFSFEYPEAEADM